MDQQGKDNGGGVKEPRRRSGAKKLVRRLALGLGGLVAVLAIALVVVSVLSISLDLSAFRKEIESAAGKALGREFAVDGPITVRVGLTPRAEIQGVRVGNPSGWPTGDLARLDRASAQIRLLPLLQGEVRIDDVSLDGLSVNLETTSKGEVNWTFGDPEEKAAAAPVTDEHPAPMFRFVELGTLSLRDVLLKFDDPERVEPLELGFEEISGAARHGESLSVSVNGSIQGVPYQAELTSGSVREMVAPSEPWPLVFSAAVLGAKLSLEGSLVEPLRGRGIDARFDFSGPVMKDFQELLKTELPEIQAFHLTGRVLESDGSYQISELGGEIAATNFASSFEADLSGERPVISGAVEIPSIDVGPLFAAIRTPESELGGEPTGTPPAVASEPKLDEGAQVDLDALILTLEPFSRFDANFQLVVGEVVNGPLGFRDASLKVAVVDGGLKAPLAATIANVPFQGEIGLSNKDAAPEISVALGADQSDIGELAALLLKVEGIEGRFGEVRLDFGARGETLRSLLATSELGFELSDASLSYGHESDGVPVEFTLKSASMTFPAASESTVSAEGTLLGEPFSLAFNGGTFIDNFIERTWPIDFSATGGGAELRIDGVVRRAEAESGSVIDFSLSGDRIGGLATWLGISPDAGQSYALRGKARHTESGVSLNVAEAGIGNSRFSGELGFSLRDETRVTILDLAFEELDLKGLGVLMAGREAEKPTDTAKEALTVDVPILPTGIALFDSDLDITIARVRMDPTDATQVAFSARIRDGFMPGAPVGLTIGGARFDGSFSLDLRQDVPKVGAEVHSDKVNVGRLLAELNIAKGLDISAQRFDLDLALEGSSPRQILERSEFSVAARQGMLKIRPPGMESGINIRLRKGTLRARRGEPISLDMNGAIQETPVRIKLSTHALAEFAESKDRLRTRLDVALANAKLALTGTAPLPVDAGNLHFTMDFGGERFSDFDELLEVSLPPVGPYRVRGKFGSRKSGYYVDDLRLDVGDSVLTGKFDFQTIVDPPRLEVDLVAKSIQLDDFDVGEWSPSGEDEESTEASGSASARKQFSEKEEELRAILSPEVMQSLDGRIGVQVEEVLSGEDRLGSGELTLTLDEGRLVADPLTLEVPGGGVDLRLALEPTENEVMLEAGAKVSDFNYGILARRIDPVSDVGGDISVDIDLETRGPNLDRVMEGANGYLNFDVRPKDLNAKIFDLWAVNLFLALMPSLDSTQDSRVNCIVGRFQIDDGIMRPAALLVDSTRIQASGDGVIDFKTDTIDFTAAPKSKRPQMFSAKTPVQVTGKFSDFVIGLAPGAAFGTGVRIITSPIVVPFQWILTEKISPDGKVACELAWSGGEQETVAEPPTP